MRAIRQNNTVVDEDKVYRPDGKPENKWLVNGVEWKKEQVSDNQTHFFKRINGHWVFQYFSGVWGEQNNVRQN